MVKQREFVYCPRRGGIRKDTYSRAIQTQQLRVFCPTIEYVRISQEGWTVRQFDACQ